MTTDPMVLATPNTARELFDRFSKEASGFPQDAVIGAVMNIVINALRQQHSSSLKAEQHFDELMGRTKAVLMDHYIGPLRKQGTFPFPQTIHANLFNSRNKFPGE